MAQRKRPVLRGWGAWLRAAREEKGFTQEELAIRIFGPPLPGKRANVSTISNWETEQTRPDEEEIRKLVVNLGISPATLLELMGYPVDVRPEAKLSADEWALIHHFRTMAPDDRRVLRRFVENVSAEARNGSEAGVGR